MTFRYFSGDLPNWPAVQSRFGIRRTLPTFVFALTGSRYGEYLALVIWSDDGYSFAAAAAIKKRREAAEEISRPFTSSRWQHVANKLAGLSPVAAHYGPEIRYWVERVRPPVVPAIVSLDGPETHVLRLLRDALGLTGARLKEMVGKARLMRVDPVQYNALAHWAPRFPRVTISTEVHDVRT